MDFDLGNALLPPLDWEDFQATATYQLLVSCHDDCVEICKTLTACELSDLEFTSNPKQGLHTMYDQEDFDEIIAFIEENGKRILLPYSVSKAVQRRISVFDTSVGRFAVCRISTKRIDGILNKI